MVKISKEKISLTPSTVALSGGCLSSLTWKILFSTFVSSLHYLWSGDKIFGALNWTCFGFLTFTIWLKKQLIISYLVPGQCLNWSLLSFVDKRTEGERSTRSPFWMRSTTYRVLFLGQFWMRSTTSPMLAVLGQFLLQQQKLCHKPFLDWSWYQSQLSVCLCAGMPDVAWVAWMNPDSGLRTFGPFWSLDRDAAHSAPDLHRPN